MREVKSDRVFLILNSSAVFGIR